jgi:hypothetical protein
VLTQDVRAQLTRMRLLWRDVGSDGRGKGREGNDWVEQTTGWMVQPVKAVHRYKRRWVPNDIPLDQIDWSQCVPTPGFQVIPRRWVVHRTFTWFSPSRRLNWDDERLSRHQRGLDLFGHDPPHAAPVRSLLRGFQTGSRTPCAHRLTQP